MPIFGDIIHAHVRQKKQGAKSLHSSLTPSHLSSLFSLLPSFLTSTIIPISPSYKSAGSSIRSLLESLCKGKSHVTVLTGGGHWTPSDIRKEPCNDKKIETTATFTFVRDPVARFISSMIETQKRRRPFALAVEALLKGTDRPVVEVAIEAMVAQKLMNIDEHLIPQL